MASSSPVPAAFNNLQEEIDYYKRQYEHLESELQDFQASSRELETELEKDIEASEKRERGLREKVELLNYEVDEWKVRDPKCLFHITITELTTPQAKYKQSKSEANTVQNGLQKEITQLRESNRSQLLRLRDIEVANDDYERQARNTTSSLEDMESRYNQAIERGVMLEEEMKTGEQERETLRIDAQRLRDELSDLKIEAEITREKLKSAEAVYGKRLKRMSQFSDPKEMGVQSPISEGSVTSASLPSSFTPERPKSQSSNGNGSDAITPPSPPLSEKSGSKQNLDGSSTTQTQLNKDATTERDSYPTPRPTANAAANRAIQNREKPRHGPNRVPPAFTRPRAPIHRPRASGVTMEGSVPRSESLYQIRGLIGKMQKLEQRVHSARSKLPAPTNTPPRASPRGESVGPSALSSEVPSNVTVRSKKRASGSTNASVTPSQAPTEDSVRRLNHRRSRISFSGPTSAAEISSRPASRASNVSHNGPAQPGSRVEIYGRPSSAAEPHRPRSSLAGRTTPYHHYHRQSISVQEDGEDNEDSFVTPTPRRTTEKGASAIPAPANLARRQSNQALANGTTPGRRKSMKQVSGLNSAVPRPSMGRKSIDLGETF